MRLYKEETFVCRTWQEVCTIIWLDVSHDGRCQGYSVQQERKGGGFGAGAAGERVANVGGGGGGGRRKGRSGKERSRSCLTKKKKASVQFLYLTSSPESE